MTPLYPVRLNNDAGSPPRGPRQMAGSTPRPPPWPRSPPLLSVRTCTPTLPSSSLFLPHLSHTHARARTHAAQCSREKMNHLDSAAVCHTRLHAAPARRAKRLQGNQEPRTEKNFKTFVKRCGMFPRMLIEEIPRFANHDASRTIRKKKMADLKESNSSVQE